MRERNLVDLNWQNAVGVACDGDERIRGRQETAEWAFS